MKKSLLALALASGIATNAQIVPLGTAANMYTLVNANTHPLAANDACNTVLFLHRSDIILFPADNIAHYRYDISTNKGNSFILNQGKLNPTANNTTVSCRYPQTIIDNPTNAANAADVYMQYMGTFHNGGEWDGITTGAAKLDNSPASFTEGNTDINSKNIGVVTSMCKGANNSFWGIVEGLEGTTLTGDIVVLKGTKTGNAVTWATNNVLSPAFDENNNIKHLGALNIDFDPSGQNGWISFLGDLRFEDNIDIDEVFDINFYKTNDGGATWKGPFIVNLNEFDTIKKVFTLPFDDVNAVSAAFESDMAVDASGNPHLFYAMGYGSTSAAIAAGNGYSVRASNLFDMTFDKNSNRFVNIFVGRVNQLRADSIGNVTNTTTNVVSNNTEDMRLQVMKTPNADKIYFSWTDNVNQASFGGPDTVIQSPKDRFLHIKGLNPITGLLSPTRIVSAEENYADSVGRSGGSCYFFTAAPVVQRSTADSSTMPIVFGRINVNNLVDAQASFFYMQNIGMKDSMMQNNNQKDTLGFEIIPPFPAAIGTVEKNNFQVYPNPATDHFTMANITGKNNTVNVYSVNGSLVYTENFGSATIKPIHIDCYQAGNYVVELISDGVKSQTKLLKK